MTPVERYLAGESSAVLAREAGVAASTMRRWLRKQGVQIRPVGGPRALTPEQEAQLVASGAKHEYLAALYGVSRSVVHRTLKRAAYAALGAGVGPENPQRVVPERWGYPFWEVVRDFAEQGLSRTQVARAIGYSPQGFRALLAHHPDKDPFEPYGVVAGYVRDAGEPLGVAVEHMAKRGFSVGEAARMVGFKNAKGLRCALQTRGIPDPFPRRATAAPPAASN